MGIMTAIAIGGLAMQAASKYREGQEAAAEAKGQAYMSDYNQKVAEQNAKAIEAKTNFEQIRAQRRGERISGSLKARLGASGAMVSEGAPANVLSEQAVENALDVALIGIEGRTEAGQQRSAATLYGMEAKNYRAQARNARRAGRIGAGTTLLTGFSNMGQQGMFEGTSLGKLWG